MRLIINGINGGMGQHVLQAAQATEDCYVVAGIDHMSELHENPCPVFSDFEACDVEADVVIDFSRPDALKPLLTFCKKVNARPVIATTGFSEDDLAMMDKFAEELPVFHTANMSLGVNLQANLAKVATGFLGEAFEVEIIEKHHHRKVDAPSGTALLLADNINEVANGAREYVYGRHTKTEKRKPNEIGIHAVRGGTIVGEHEILFIGDDEIVELTHKALSRKVFAQGSIRAAQFIIKQEQNRVYNMNDIVNQTKTVTHLYADTHQAIITIRSLKSGTQGCAKLFNALADANILIDMISQSAPIGDTLDISFSLDRRSVDSAVTAIDSAFSGSIKPNIDTNSSVTKLVVAGPGMEYQTGVTAKLFDALAKENVSVYAVTTSETEIACCVHDNDTTRTKAALKSIFSI